MATTEWSVGERFRSRFWQYVGGNLSRYGGLPRSGTAERLALASGRKLPEYVVRWAYYENKRLYEVLNGLGFAPAMPTEWNPVPACVAFYMANTLGRDLAIVAEQDGRQEAVAAAVEQVWQWSNFGRLAEELVETAAVLSDAFVRVAEKVDADTGETTAVYLQVIPPETVRSVVTDERGFVTSIRIDTPRQESVFGTEARNHVHVEFWRKRWPDTADGGVRFYEIGSAADVEDERLTDAVRAQTFEELGYDFIPVVYGRATAHWWFMTDQIDQYNRQANRLHRLNRPTGVIHGRHVDADGRPMPAPRVQTTEQTTTYEESADGAAGWIRVPGNSEFTWASSPIDFGAAVAQLARIRQGVEDALPEYRVATLDATQVATETLQVLFGMAGERVLSLRETLEAGLSRAQEMALSMGQLAGLPGFEAATIGTWEDGGIRHGFEERDVFTPTAGMVAAAFQQFKAGGLPDKLAMRAAGFEEAAIDEYDEAAADQALRERTTLAAQLVRQRALVDSGAADNGRTRL